MEWFGRLPRSIAFVDVETTGLNADDRIVSLGAFWLASSSLCDRIFPVSFVHLIFNPARRSHPRAAQVHGYSDWLLEHQEPFETYVTDVRNFLCSADLVVAHNAEFDLGFINKELQRAGRAMIDRPSYCTMEACRSRGSPGGLDAACKELGRTRAGKRQGALEDAWLAMMVYLWLHGSPTHLPFSEAGSLLEPFNQRPAPAHSTETRRFVLRDSPSVDTGRSRAATPTEANRIEALVEEIKQLKRDGMFDRAEALLIAEVNRQENHASATGMGVAPWYYEQLAVIYSKQQRFADEASILKRYAIQPEAPGAKPAQLLDRLKKVQQRTTAR
jgi:DNA polymerase III subunit epsilon